MAVKTVRIAFTELLARIRFRLHYRLLGTKVKLRPMPAEISISGSCSCYMVRLPTKARALVAEVASSPADRSRHHPRMGPGYSLALALPLLHLGLLIRRGVDFEVQHLHLVSVVVRLASVATHLRIPKPQVQASEEGILPPLGGPSHLHLHRDRRPRNL
jgi:hypothetical protein